MHNFVIKNNVNSVHITYAMNFVKRNRTNNTILTAAELVFKTFYFTDIICLQVQQKHAQLCTNYSDPEKV